MTTTLVSSGVTAQMETSERSRRTPKPRLSIIVPAYNEERRLPHSLERLAGYIAGLDRAADVIVVENGSTDGTADVVRSYQRTMPYLHLLQVTARGKGWAVRAGMLAATGDYLMFCDADFSMPVEETERFLTLLDDGAPIVIASRELPSSRRHDEPPRRHAMGRFYNRVVRALVVDGIDDTQCGFKAFHRAVARDLFNLQRTRGWAFDAELLYLARRRGYAVYQLPIDWYYDGDSRVRQMSDSLSMLGETLRIRAYAALHFYGRRRSQPQTMSLSSPLSPEPAAAGNANAGSVAAV